MENEKNVGTILREARLAKGLTLADVEQGTSIRSRYLEALENSEYDKAPEEVFLKGIIRNYGNFLGLDGPELVNMYKASMAGTTTENVRSAGIREVDKVQLNIQLKERREIGSGTGRLELPMKQILAGIVVLGILAAGYFVIPAAIDYAKNMPKSEPAQQQAAAPAEQPAAAAQAAPVLDKVLVEMEAGGPCWLEVNSDGQELFAGMLQPGDKRTYEAKDRMIVKYGNVGVMKVNFNGQPQNMAGEQGVAIKTYTLNAGVINN